MGLKCLGPCHLWVTVEKCEDRNEASYASKWKLGCLGLWYWYKKFGKDFLKVLNFSFHGRVVLMLAQMLEDEELSPAQYYCCRSSCCYCDEIGAMNSYVQNWWQRIDSNSVAWNKYHFLSKDFLLTLYLPFLNYYFSHYFKNDKGEVKCVFVWLT